MSSLAEDKWNHQWSGLSLYRYVIRAELSIDAGHEWDAEVNRYSLRYVKDHLRPTAVMIDQNPRLLYVSNINQLCTQYKRFLAYLEAHPAEKDFWSDVDPGIHDLMVRDACRN